MNLPKIDGLTSEICLLECEDGRRRVGYYHCNGYWYELTEFWITLLTVRVIKWEYLNETA